MRVGIICPYSLTVPGGVQGQVLGLTRSLRSTGVDVRLLAPCDGPPPDPGVTPLGNSIPTAANGSIAPLAPDPPAQLRTIRAIRDEDFDVLNLHEPMAPGPTITAMLLDAVPMVGTFHAAGTSSAYRWLNPGLRWLDKRLSYRIAVSEDAKALAGGALGGRFTVLFNGIEVERYVKATPWPTERPTIFFIARHEPRKGLSQLLDAMVHLPPDIRLWVAGEGDETEALKRRWAGDARIEWLGRISDEEKAQRLRGAQVFCAPSLRGESFGVVLLEAMAAGCAVVASSLPGYARVARDGEDALLVEPGDSRALAAALERVLTDEHLSAELIGAGEHRAEQFSMVKLAERYAEILEAVAQQRRT